MARILVIAPYSGLKDLFLEVNADLKKQIQVEVGDLYKGLSIAKEMEDEEFDVIISRGATAHLLRQHCNIPVIEMKISGYDILRTLTLVKGYPGKIGLMSYFNTIEGADVVGTLLEMDLSFYPIDREDDIESGIRKSIEEGVQVIIGDVITTTTAANFGLHSILIISGRESVIAAIEEAEQVAYYTKKEKKERQFFEAIASSYHEGMIAVDNTGKVQLLNKQAEIYLGTNEKELVGEQIEKINPLLSVTDILSGRKEDTEEVCTLYGEDFVLRKRALYDNKDLFGGVIFLERAEEVQRVESQIRHRLFSNQSTAKAHFNQLVAINENVKLQIENAYKLSRNDLAVLIYGEPGSGKQSLAQAIHNESSRKGSPFVFLNCEAYSEEQLEVKIFGSTTEQGAFEVAHNGTLFIDAIGKMPLSIQAKLINVLQENKITQIDGEYAIPINVPLISANTHDLKEDINKGHFREDLYHLISEATLVIPPLRERIEDIPELIRWFIASFDEKFGKQIVGFRPEVLERLKQAKWPGNVQQLKNITERICMAGTGPFIDLDEITDILDDLLVENHQVNDYGNVIEISGKTLEELEKEIITRVLAEEDYNQSHAAKRLGINRSTLWRKIKEKAKK